MRCEVLAGRIVVYPDRSVDRSGLPESRSYMSVPKRRIDFDPALPFGDFLRLLNVSKESVSMVVEGESVVVELHPAESTRPYSNLSNEEKWELSRSAIGGWKGLIDGDALIRQIYADRDADRDIPPVEIDG